MFTTRPEIKGTFGVVASTHWIASAVGMAVLEQGGNAFDAAVAAGFTLQVVEPHLNGPAGEVPILIHAAAEQRQRVICGQGVAPAMARIEAFADLGLNAVPGTGLLAATTPGCFDAWMLLLRDYGTLKVGDILQFAIGYARDGYPLVPQISAVIQTVAELFATEWPTSAALYLNNGQAPAIGDRFRNPDLAATYARIVVQAEAAGADRVVQIEAARRIWSQGFIAAAIDEFSRGTEVLDSSGRRHRGFLTGEDMARWQASYEAPLSYEYHGHTVLKAGFWSQGPVFLQALAILKAYDLAAMPCEGPDFVHTVVEALKLAYSDREAFYGDPHCVSVPATSLLSDEYAAQRRGMIKPTASMEFLPGTIPGHPGRIAAGARTSFSSSAGNQAVGGGEPTLACNDFSEARTDRDGAVRGDTCHLDVIDRWGNMVSATPSGGWLQSSPAIPGLGFALGTRAQMFWLDPAAPSALAPGRRPRSTLTPGLALRDGRPYLAFGTPGGDQQDQWALVFFLRHVHHALNLQESIDAPTFHSEHFPGSFYPRAAFPGRLRLEGRFAAQTIDALRQRGHRVLVGDPWSLGRLCAAAQEDGWFKAAANPRGMQGYAVGR